MSRGARPLVVLGARDHPGSNRIAFDIAERCPRVSLIQHARKRPRLPEVSALAVLLVELRGIDSMAVLEGLGDRVLAERLANNVNVIGHQAVPGDVQSVALRVGPQQLQIALIVGFLAKHVDPPVSALRDVMRIARKDNPSHSSHRSMSAI